MFEHQIQRKRTLFEPAKKIDSLRNTLEEIRYEHRYGVGRCDKVEALKTKTRKLIRDADYKERFDIIIEAQNLLGELNESDCY